MSGNACYHLVQNLLSCNLLFKNIKIKKHRTIIFPVLVYKCEARTLTLREESILKVFEHRVLRGIFVPMRDEETG